MYDEYDTYVSTLIQEISSLAKQKEMDEGITITIDIRGNCHYKMHPDLAQILIINLFKNAMVHNHPMGFVHIVIEADSISVENSGNEEPLDTGRIFERFYKKGDKGKSTGLGLAIVKEIVDLLGIGLKYRYEEKHIFALFFKK